MDLHPASGIRRRALGVVPWIGLDELNLEDFDKTAQTICFGYEDGLHAFERRKCRRVAFSD
jgi:hypothetical protein